MKLPRWSKVGSSDQKTAAHVMAETTETTAMTLQSILDKEDYESMPAKAADMRARRGETAGPAQKNKRKAKCDI